MSAELDLIEQSGPLKEQILEYAMSRRYRKELQRFMAQEIDPDDPPEDSTDLINLMDAFILEHRLGDGKTVVEHFVASHSKLTQAGRDLLLGWRTVVEGVFQVDQGLGDALIVHNLIDDMTYIVYSNLGPGSFLDIEAGSYLLMRIVPVRDVWLVSGTISMLPAEEREAAEKTAISIMLLRPTAIFRNPEKLKRAWDVQHRQRTAFINRYGSDLLVVSSDDLVRVTREYALYLRYGEHDAQGTPISEIVAHERQDPETLVGSGELDDLFDETFGDGLSVMYFDEFEGLLTYRDFGLVDAAFADPSLAGERTYRDAIAQYIKDPDVSPAIVRRLVERHPDTAEEAIKRALNRTKFSWQNDSERLLRRYKPAWFDREPTPMLMTLLDVNAVEEGVVPDWFMSESD